MLIFPVLLMPNSSLALMLEFNLLFLAVGFIEMDPPSWRTGSCACYAMIDSLLRLTAIALLRVI